MYLYFDPAFQASLRLLCNVRLPNRLRDQLGWASIAEKKRSCSPEKSADQSNLDTSFSPWGLYLLQNSLL